MQHCEALPLITTTYHHHIPPYSTMFPLPFGRVRGCKPKVPTAKITILIPWFPCTIMHKELLQRWDERSRPRGSARPSFDDLKHHELPHKWLICSRCRPCSYWGIANEFKMFNHVLFQVTQRRWMMFARHLLRREGHSCICWRIGLAPFFLKSMEALSLTCHQGELNWELLTTPLTLKEMPSGSWGVFSHLDPFSGGSDRMYVSHSAHYLFDYIQQNATKFGQGHGRMMQKAVSPPITFSSWTRKNCPTFSHMVLGQGQNLDSQDDSHHSYRLRFDLNDLRQLEYTVNDINWNEQPRKSQNLMMFGSCPQGTDRLWCLWWLNADLPDTSWHVIVPFELDHKHWRWPEPRYIATSLCQQPRFYLLSISYPS